MGCYHNQRNAYQNSFKPSPEWDIMTATAMRIKIPLSHLQNGILSQPPQCISNSLEIKLINMNVDD
jgi:hypothetical protein